MQGRGGRIAARSPSLTTHLTIYDVGAQVQYYPWGQFRHGMQIGAQVLYERYDSPFTHQDPIFGNALAAGPFAGYKRAFQRGFTLEAQIGYQRTWIWQHTPDELANATVRVTDSGLLLNLNVGWSF